MKNIDLDVFLAIMDGQVTEGDNDTFYVGESGVRSTFAPTVADRAELARQGHLFSKKTRGGPRDENKQRTGELQQSEADVLREFANECRFDFPITLDTAMEWAANIISMDPSEVEANYRRLKGEPPKRAKPGPQKQITDEILDCAEKFMREDDMPQGEACRETAKLYFPDDDYLKKAESIERKLRERREKQQNH